MELDAKQRVLIAIYTEYQKDIPDMETNIKASILGIEKDTFKIALDKLTNEGLITGVSFSRGGRGIAPVAAIPTHAKMTPQGIEYVEDKLNISNVLTGEEKVKTVLGKVAEWGLDQLKDVAARTLVEMSKQ